VFDRKQIYYRFPKHLLLDAPLDTVSV